MVVLITDLISFLGYFARDLSSFRKDLTDYLANYRMANNLHDVHIFCSRENFDGCFEFTMRVSWIDFGLAKIKVKNKGYDI